MVFRIFNGLFSAFLEIISNLNNLNKLFSLVFNILKFMMVTSFWQKNDASR